ncbi:MAG: endonuclease III [Holosporaceae bacterium]|jgi:endonuclease-3|nr:endonuclease III [Holosporaceae bacterium]
MESSGIYHNEKVVIAGFVSNCRDGAMSEFGRVETVCRRLMRQFPNAKTELEYMSEYAFLVAVVLSAQTTDVQVNRVTSELFRKCKTPDDIMALGLEKLQNEIKSIGLYRNKAKFIMRLTQALQEEYGGKIPQNRSQLESLPGVGRKTANVVLNTLFGQDVIAVDTHVLRVSKRLDLSRSTNPLVVEMDLERIIPKKYKRLIGNMLVLHGRYVCKAKRPDCANCVLRELCNWNVG